MPLAADARILTPTGYQTVTDLVAGAAIFDASSLDKKHDLKVSVPQATAAQATVTLVMADGSTITCKGTQEFLVYTDYSKNQTAWVAASALVALDKMVRVARNGRAVLDVTLSPSNAQPQVFDYVEFESRAAAAGTPESVYDFSAVYAKMNALIVSGGLVARMYGALLSTFVADDTTPSLNQLVTVTLTLFAPVPNLGSAVDYLYVAIDNDNGRVTPDKTRLKVAEGALTGTVEVTAAAAGAENVNAKYDNDGVAESVPEGLVIS